MNDEAHMAPAGFVIVEERREAIDFLEVRMKNLCITPLSSGWLPQHNLVSFSSSSACDAE